MSLLNPYGKVTAYRAGAQLSRLWTHIPNRAHWPEIERWWMFLQEEIASLRWFPSQTPNPASEIVEPSRPNRPQPVKDSTDKKILDLVTENPDFTDDDVVALLAARYEIFISRQAVNPRRKRLELMGYKVR